MVFPLLEALSANASESIKKSMFSKLKNINWFPVKDKTSIRGFLVLLLVAQVLNLGVFKGLELGSQKLGQYIYSQTSEPFLSNSPIIHKGLATGLTINILKK